MGLGIIIFGLLSGSLASVLVGLLGSRRRIGFGWAFLASLLLTPIIGLIITLFSDTLPYEANSRRGCLGTTLGLLGLLFLLLIFVAAFLLLAGFLVL